jgi:hypothetical protein
MFEVKTEHQSFYQVDRVSFRRKLVRVVQEGYL